MREQLIFPLADAPTPQCHASTLAELPDGTLCAAWFGGTHEKNPDVGIWFARRRDGVWEKPRCVADSEDPHWNPVLFVYDGVLQLYYMRGANPRDWSSLVMESRDGGESFTEPRELVVGDRLCRGPIKNKPIRVGRRILAPASIESPSWFSFIDRSDDGGFSWEKSNYIYTGAEQAAYNASAAAGTLPEDAEKPAGTIQPTLWATSETDIYALFRSNRGRIFRSESHDGGISWAEAVPTGLPNNNSGIDAVRLQDGRIALVCNPVGTNWGSRSPISLLISGDNGVTWRHVCNMDYAPGEFSYPAVIQKKCGDLCISYTWYRRSICVVDIPLSDI
ncbi:MAG: exo-alpha-sialidase [Clostridia bacterium]|nr:exo-alpha-sialidase [Clostridia bacterium]